MTTKQILSSLIGIAADSVEKLRFSDVERVLTEAPAERRQELAQFIVDSRPEFENEVNEVMVELRPAASTGVDTVELVGKLVHSATGIPWRARQGRAS